MIRRAPRPPVVIGVAALAAGLAVLAVLGARALLADPAASAFFAAHPAVLPPPPGTPEGFPVWMNLTHALNAVLLAPIAVSGLRVWGGRRPPAFVTRAVGPRSADRPPRRLSVHVWWHLVLDTLWVLNGVVYLVLLLATGQWMRLIPTTWEIVPAALTSLVEYVALAWPAHDGWVAYNGLQQLAYAATVFLAAPLAILTGLRLSPLVRPGGRVARLLPEAWARRVHLVTLGYLVVFTVVHVGLVLTTGALRNLNGMFAARHDESPVGLVIAAVVTAAAVAVALLAPSAQARIAERLRQDVRRMPPAPR